MISRTALFVISLVGFALIGGCSPYVEDFHFAPHPAIAEIKVATTQPSQMEPSPVTAYATIVGIRREDSQQHLPLSVEVRLRLDNNGSQSITFDPQSMELTNGDLVRFPPPVLPPPQEIPVLPGQPVMVQANFPFPPHASYDNMNLQTLQLNWAVRIDGHDVAQTANFHLVHQYYVDPYWGYPPYPYGYPYPYYGYPYFGFGGTFIIRR
jgi:hypothetical protein